MKQILLLIILVLFSACTEAQQPEQTVELANVAYDQFDLKKSHKILEAILAIDTLQDEQKCEVLRKLAHQDWKYYQNHALAKRRLIKAASLGDAEYDTWMLATRIEREAQYFDKALKAALKARELAKSENEVMRANTAYARIVYEISKDQLEKKTALNTNLLLEASTLLSTVLNTNAGLPAPSKLLLGIALLNNDGKNVLKAWQSYFQIQDIKNISPYLSSSAKKLNQVSQNWQGDKLTVSAQAILIDALASSRFYEFIPAYIQKNNNASAYNQETKDIITYARYLKEIEEGTNEYYRLIAIEQAEEPTYIVWLNDKRKELWQKLSFTNNKEYSESDFLSETEKHFGARGFTGSTGNYNGYVLCLGHTVNQEKAKVEQYGYQPEFTYTQVDMMISNGFSSWFWEDKAIGGWATDNEIIRVREVYLNGPFTAWKMMTDSTEKQKVEKTIRTFLNSSATSQLELAEGLAVLLKLEALRDLYDSLSSIGLSGQALKLAFLSKYEQYRVEASLLAHEGRHSIEQKYMPAAFEKWDNEKREFHAKLSQIIFATEPRLELAGMVQDVSGDSGHAKANKQIVDVAIEWIKEHKQKITGYSDDRPAFSQIYLLTIEQIKECYKQADPLNK